MDGNTATVVLGVLALVIPIAGTVIWYIIRMNRIQAEKALDKAHQLELVLAGMRGELDSLKTSVGEHLSSAPEIRERITKMEGVMDTIKGQVFDIWSRRNG